ncbi:glycosyltransferase [Liberiplasma polymorphum]|uniref:glycosyltransferase n=1 Tax=Liberiplasma polymorphum TaxID=3374570 RepID=UPI0037745CF8
MRILFLNPQGNFDRNDSFWTEHPDFGGQLVYVKEIAMSIAKLGHKVDIVTRKFEDETFDCFNQTFDFYKNIDNLRIVRIPCGPNTFVQKEHLWEYLAEWVDHINDFYKSNNEPFDFITTHYGDGGLAGAMLSKKTNVPFSFTGHSLGAQKMDKLNVSHENIHALNQKYQFSKRLLAERISMIYASKIFVSTKQERDEQYKHPAYVNAGDVKNPEKFVVAPPGANTEMFSKSKPNDIEESVYQLLDNQLKRDISSDRVTLPYIVAASRLDPKKNHSGLLKAYASSPTLQSIANIAISLRGIENAFADISPLKETEQLIMIDLFKIIDDYQLHGKVAFINITSQKALAASYRYFASKHSVFALTALYEPFGLAPIEAMSAGLPAAVTKYGGPSEVLKENEETFGVLLDVHDLDKTAHGLIQVFKHYDYYQKQGLKRVQSTYTWDATANTYIEAIKECLSKREHQLINIPDYFDNPNEDNDFKLDPIINHYFPRKKTR